VNDGGWETMERVGRMWAVVNVESDEPPVAMFADESSANTWLASMQARCDDWRLSVYHRVLPVDVDRLLLWNSYGKAPALAPSWDEVRRAESGR